MRWGALGVPFVRPIHWVVALLNGKVIPFEFAGVKSGNQTRGHRFMAPDSQVVSDVEDFLNKMADGFVLIDQQKRQEAVIRVTRKAAAAVGAQPAEDPELVTTVTHLVEYPSAVCGSFDSDFLNLPDPVLITAMKEHQKYFALYDNERRLMPNFIAVNNTVATDEAVVRKGHERVLRARLSDASFFFKEDQRRALKERLEDLKGVIYQTDLGTSFAKVMRFTRLADYVGRMVIPDQLDDVRLAATLCKCDLVTQMVTEFPSLQGTMGMEYARIEGYPEPICLAIREHYLPVRAGDQIPTGPLGAVVGVADRMDTIVGCFAVGLEPSGSADPFALRRHALAILRIMEHTGWQVSLSEMVQYAISVLQEEIGLETGPLFHGVMEFFRERYKQSMLRAGYESGLIEAVISVGFDRINELRARIENLRGFVAESPEFEPLALTAKRVTNILKAEKEALEVDPVLFKDPCETALWSAYGHLKAELYSCLQKGSHDRALEILCKFRKPVDDFFEGVEILTKKDEALRANRLGLLQHLQKLFLSVADFSKFSI
jgi:glycyl-tRNA synthetase beta chain